MKVVHPRCVGLDVHKKIVVACVITPDQQGGWCQEIQTFTTMTADLLKLSDWLLTRDCTHVAMESTGECWKPVFNILEANFEVMLVNAQHIKAVPGRKTDVKDASVDWSMVTTRIAAPQLYSPDCSTRLARLDPPSH